MISRNFYTLTWFTEHIRLLYFHSRSTLPTSIFIIIQCMTKHDRAFNRWSWTILCCCSIHLKLKYHQTVRDLTLKTWYPSVPPPGTSELWVPPILYCAICDFTYRIIPVWHKMAERGKLYKRHFRYSFRPQVYRTIKMFFQSESIFQSLFK